MGRGPGAGRRARGANANRPGGLGSPARRDRALARRVAVDPRRFRLPLLDARRRTARRWSAIIRRFACSTPSPTGAGARPPPAPARAGPAPPPPLAPRAPRTRDRAQIRPPLFASAAPVRRRARVAAARDAERGRACLASTVTTTPAVYGVFTTRVPGSTRSSNRALAALHRHAT
jgi:hypothetical protein